MPPKPRPIRVLAVASAGGHWVQMTRLIAAFDGCEIHFATTEAHVAHDVRGAPVHIFPDANKDTPVAMLRAMASLVWIVLRLRPDAIVSTGAAGGALAIAAGRLIGARGLFVDSIANAQRLSLSARIARRFGLVLSQWPDVAAAERVGHSGSVL
jgi:Oligosaccharide biosynthesis protein Alg14 like.